MNEHANAGRAHLTTFVAAMLLSGAVVFWMAGPYLLSVFFGGMMAMVVHPFYERLRAWGAGPRVAATTCTILLLGVIIGPVTAFSFAAAEQGVAVGRRLVEAQAEAPGRVMRALERIPSPARAVMGDPAEFNQRLRGYARTAGERSTAAILGLGKKLPEAVLQIALALISFFFMLVDGRRFVRYVLRLSPLEEDVEGRLMDSFRDTAVSSVLAGLAAATVQSVILLSAYLLLGIPAPFLAGGATFLLAWVPFLGSMPATAAGVLYLWSEGETARLIGMLAAGALAGVSDNAVRPMVLQGRQEMHPLIGLVSVFGGLSAFGFLGLFVGPILAALFLALLDAWPTTRGRMGFGERRRG